jgi:large subunit ribosomal protein L1
MGKTKTAFVSDLDNEPKKKQESQKKSEKVHISGLKGGQRIKAIEAEPIETVEEEAVQEKKKKAPRVRGKNWTDAKAQVDRDKEYKLIDAIKLCKKTSYSKFDGTMEMHLIVKKQGLTINASLPFSAGKQKKIEIASDETVNKLKSGKIDFDILIATPEMMPKLVSFARILGPKGLMPNPKNGTLITDIKKAKDFSANSVTLKTEKDAPLMHTTFGKVSQKEEELEKNAQTLITAISPKQIIKAYIKPTMGPSVKIKVS